MHFYVLYKDMPVEILSKIPDNNAGVGVKNIEMHPASTRVVMRNGAWIDLSGIAKGYIVDRMSSCLQNKGIGDFLVNAGGDMYCGIKKSGRNWRIGLRKPGEEKVVLVLELTGRAIATSGDYENVVVDKASGRELSHIVDPVGGASISKMPSSFTVIAPDCATADALATGMMAMGVDRALELADRIEGVEVIIAGIKEHPDGIMFSSAARDNVVER
jgi:FAD:protein FMN transferase